MTLLSKILFDHCDVEVSPSPETEDTGTQDLATVNPATGLAMLKGSTIDVAGNPLGTDFTEGQTSSCSFQDFDDHLSDSFSCDSLHSHSATIFDCDTSNDFISDSFDSSWDSGFDEY
ncbi:hypothetical protein CA267_015995 [Alteromonas pelagimontana]|uniref:Uncharacterized protein n=1 Tax=Alteromonas pelagimontana TaxID=1858656 RepID=A0A6M4MG35_9ALTE|nr:hypothetical protein [Alteromonas pelagimontana]QJR82144.1 hypothetical protein CA267_015995 [Alteromonas pelagimontana]